ncbi:MAG: hypothetical protein IJ833_07315 [Lachnospiraceae bacterium]|nr:hypothetical protein [Lachnospiraceae bacterium]
MLAVLLKILSIIGIALLVLLGIVLVLLVLVLFVPVTYRACGRKNTEVMACNAQVRWLFGFLRGVAEYKERFGIRAKILCFTIYDSQRKQEPRQLKPKRTKIKQTESSGEEKITEVEKREEETPSQADDAREEALSGNSSRDLSKLEKIRYTIHSIYDKIRDISEDIGYYKSILDDRDTRKLLDHVFFRLGKVLKALKPGKCKADILFGTGSPDTTGYVFGAYGMVSPHLGEEIVVTPDFTQAILEGEFEIAGRVMVFTILVQAIKILLDRRLWMVLDKIKQKP